MVRNPFELSRPGVFALACLLMSGAAVAAPRSINDCEAIKQADAYNNCLASFGPAAHVGGPTTAAPPSDEGSAAQGKSRRGGRHARVWAGRSHTGVTVLKSRNGRVRTVISLRRR
jgi:hypothetical protein